MRYISDAQMRKVFRALRLSHRIYAEKGRLYYPRLPWMMTKDYGAYVGLSRAGKFIGAMGTHRPTKPLVYLLVDSLIGLSFHDPRRPPLYDIKDFGLHVFLTYDPREGFLPGEDRGYVVEKGVESEVYLPVRSPPPSERVSLSFRVHWFYQESEGAPVVRKTPPPRPPWYYPLLKVVGL